jgi:hypothetical protein
MTDLMASGDLEQHEVFALISDLIRATDAGELQWKPSESTADFFYLETPGGTVNVQSEGGQGHPFIFRIFDGEDRQLYENKTEVAPFYSPEEEMVARLFAAAKASAYDVRGTVRRIRQSLGL